MFSLISLYPSIHPGLNATVQGISGTGTLRIGAAFLKRFYPHSEVVYLPAPSWANHAQIFTEADIKVAYYRYYDPSTLGGSVSYSVFGTKMSA